VTGHASMNLRVHAVRCEARDVMTIELRDPDRAALPPFTAGSHLELHLGNGLIRHYSLFNDPRETDRYCIGVGLAGDSRGGSKLIHETVRVGQILKLGAPRNNFPLVAEAGDVVFIAGGIGITPILSMIRVCIAEARPWTLHYCARNRARAAFYETLAEMGSASVRFHFDDEQQGRRFDARAALQAAPKQAHIYTCGPAPLMDAVAAAGTERPAGHLHFEWFAAAGRDDGADPAFTIRLAQSGREFTVPPGSSILDVLESAGFGLPYSCREGLCGTCRIGVIVGDCDHRDSVLSVAEKAANRSILPCVSRARSPMLELDI